VGLHDRPADGQAEAGALARAGRPFDQHELVVVLRVLQRVPPPPTPGSSGSSANQGKRGAIGASAQNTVCDREKLIAELMLDPKKLAAWADTVGVDADAQTVAAFIRKLRPATLTKDTQVTNTPS